MQQQTTDECSSETAPRVEATYRVSPPAAVPAQLSRRRTRGAELETWFTTMTKIMNEKSVDQLRRMHVSCWCRHVIVASRERNRTVSCSTSATCLISHALQGTTDPMNSNKARDGARLRSSFALKSSQTTKLNAEFDRPGCMQPLSDGRGDNLGAHSAVT